MKMRKNEEIEDSQIYLKKRISFETKFLIMIISISITLLIAIFSLNFEHKSEKANNDSDKSDYENEEYSKEINKTLIENDVISKLGGSDSDSKETKIIEEYNRNSNLPHYRRNPIRYKIIEDFCNDLMVSRIVESFNIIQNKTNNVVKFSRVPYEKKNFVKERLIINQTIIFIGNEDGIYKFTYFGQGGLRNSEIIIFQANKSNIFNYITIKTSPTRIEGFELMYQESNVWKNKKFYVREITGESIIINLDGGVTYYDPTEIIEYNDTEITIHCRFEQPQGVPLGYLYTPGESKTINNGQIIESARIDFYNVISTLEYKRSGGCVNYPDLEIHEILHTMGFSHNSSKESIMNPKYVPCNKIDEYIIEDLINTYSKLQEG
jgi:hypothetical protein